RCKRVRAVLRLVRDELGEKTYRRENASVRDAARPLTEVRDAKVLRDALDGLAEHFAGEVRPKAFAAARAALEENRAAGRERVRKQDGAFADVAAALGKARRRARRWSVGHKGWPALRRGLRQVYRQGRRAQAAAAADPSVENLHEWR